MAVEIIMPKMEMAQDTGTIVRWLKAEGEAVRKGEPLLEIETDKVTVEVEAPGDGILGDITAGEGDEVPVGQVIARLRSAPETAPAVRTPEPKTPPVEATAGALPAATPVAQQMAAAHQIDLSHIAPAGRRITKDDVSAHLARQQPLAGPRLLPASPLARRLAREQGLDIGLLNGSGPDGAILAADIRVALETTAKLQPAAPPATPAAAPAEGYRRIPLRRMRKVIAERLQHSYQTAPHISLTLTVDMTELQRLMANLAEPIRQATGKELTLTAVLTQVTALALSRHPRLNAHLDEDDILEFDTVHLGIAVALEDGLVVPVIRDAQTKGLIALQTELSDLAGRARANKLALDEIKGSTFTISNLGMYGIEQFTAIINPPEVAILAVGAITPGPKEIDGQLAMRPLLRLTLMVDHRAIDGATGAQFLATLKELLENPYRLLL
jgi:pyruvate dehydrogenase E2 component (dihydrolipoamide acetyltransferase)